MYKKLVILITSLLLITGCSLSSSQTETKPIPKERESLSPQTLAPLKQQIQYFVNFPERLFPKNIMIQDVHSTYEINRSLFMFIYPTSTDSNNERKIYLSNNRGKAWETFLDVSTLIFPKKLTPPFIPVGMFTNETGNIFVDLKEQSPTQEPSAIVRYQTRDAGQTWEQVGCFVFSNSDYYVNGENTQKGIRTTELTELKKCKK